VPSRTRGHQTLASLSDSNRSRITARITATIACTLITRWHSAASQKSPRVTTRLPPIRSASSVKPMGYGAEHL
jgi:hypothetical protein